MLALVKRFGREGKFLKNEIEGYCADSRVNTSNDLITDRKGNLYFTDSVRHDGKVCFLGIDGNQKIVVSGLDNPNGLVLSNDENCLYVAESYKNRIIKVKLNSPGTSVGSPDVFVNLPANLSGNEADNLSRGYLPSNCFRNSINYVLRCLSLTIGIMMPVCKSMAAIKVTVPSLLYS